MPAKNRGVAKGLTPLIFIFVDTRPLPNGLTEKEWEIEANKRGLDVETTKRVFGPASYKGPNGQLRRCTILAARKGECKTNPAPSLDKRIDMAKRVLAQDPTCEWVGFDRAYNDRTAYTFGAEEFTLHVAAKC